MALPTGTVTFLFTDIEGSTRLAQEQREAWESLRKRHNSILRAAADGQHGYTFQIIGDAFCVAFNTASDALLAALKIQKDLQDENWGDAPVRVRIGIHTGRADIQHSGDYQGYLTLSRVQRVMSVAYGGQILLSSTSAELVRGELPEGISLLDMQEHRLKGLVNPEHLWQAVSADLPREFPPLQSLNDIPTNLPIQLTSFVGRQAEIAQLNEELSRHRLVTLTGSGGTGKTRLALHVSADVLDQFKDGVWLIELAPVFDPELVPQTITTTLGLGEQRGRTLLDLLKDYLNGKKVLLLLDNCEHLIEACAQLADVLLHAAPRLRILATSREALGIAGETTFPVGSLSLPAPSDISPESVWQCDAVRLFIDRAVAVQPAFQVTNQNAPAVAEICARLDGIPLAIELAAARVKGLSVEEIASRLADRFRLLTGGSRTALPRQRTLQAAIDWSYRLLSEEERMLLRRLSVFAGGWTIAAAESVCAGHGLLAEQILDLQLHLVDKSLVVAQTEAAEPRYRMLETIRQFAQEKLDEAAETSQVWARQLAFFLALAEQAEPELSGPHQMIWLDRLEKEMDNLRAALSWAQEQDTGSILRLASASWRFWDIRGATNEGLVWLEKALALTEGEHTVIRALALGRASYMRRNLVDAKHAAQLAEEALALSRELDDKPGLAMALFVKGSSALGVNQPEAGRAYLEQALDLSLELGEHGLAGVALIDLGQEALDRNDLARARSMMKQGLQEVRASGDKRRIDYGLSWLGYVYLAEGDAAKASTLIEESVEVAQEIGDHANFVWGLLDLAWAVAYLDDFQRAQQLLDQAFRLSQERGDRIMLAFNSLYAALLAWERGELLSLTKALQDSLALGEQLDFDILKAYALYFLAQAARLQQDLEIAQERFVEAIKFFRCTERGGVPMSIDGLAALAFQTGQPERATRLFAISRKLQASTWVRFDLPFMVREHDKFIAEARAQLGDEAFNLAWAAGQAMSEEDMLAYASQEMS